MKKLVALLIVAAFATSAIAVEKPKAAVAKAAPAKKVVKHHKKFDGVKVPDQKAPAKKPTKTTKK